MTFKRQGRSYDTSTMKVFETGNPVAPIIYVGPEGEVFVIEIERVEGIEVRLADPAEAAMLAERHGFTDQLVKPDVKPAESCDTHCHGLIVEDDGSSRHALSRLLHLSGYEIVCAATVAEATAKLDQHPAWLILDLRLPDGKGTALLEHVRAQNLPIKVAITTGETDEKILSEVGSLRPDAVFRKPLDMSQVMQWIEAA